VNAVFHGIKMTNLTYRTVGKFQNQISKS